MPAGRRSADAPRLQHALIGREAELHAVSAVLQAGADGDGRALFVRGEPGSGVTSLLVAAVDTLPGGVAVISFRGLPDESALAGAAAARLATQVGLAAPCVGAGPALDVGIAEELLAACRAAAPLAIVIDDAHWLDDVTLQLLGFCANRLARSGVSLLLGSSALVRCDRLSGVDELALDGLSVAAAGSLVQQASGTTPVASVVASLVRATGGNPTALATVAAGLGPLELSGVRLLPDPPRLGARLADTWASTFADQPDVARQMLAAVAAGADTAALLQHVMGDQDLIEALSAAEAGGLVDLHEGQVRFRQPLVRAAAYHCVPATDVRAMHAALAVAPGVTPASAARHLAMATVVPDEAIARKLERAGQLASRDGAHAEAAIWFAEAHRLTTDGAVAQRRLRTAEAAAAAATARSPSERTMRSEPQQAGRSTGLRLLGGLRICVDGIELPALTGVPAQALKAVALPGALHIEVLVELLWPGAAPGVGRARLRNVLNRVRAAVGPVLVREGESILLARGVRVDVADFQDMADKAVVADATGERSSRQQLEAALAVYRGELLPADRYADWTSAPRERLARRRLQLLDLLVARCAADDDLAAALQHLEIGLELDPLDEGRYLLGAQLLAAADREAAALGLLRRAEVALSACGLPLSHRAAALVRQLAAEPALRGVAAQRQGEPAPLR